MNVLHLLPSERTLLEALPASLQDGWTVEEESLTYKDTLQKQMMRLSVVRLHDPSLIKLREKAQTIINPQQMTDLLASQDLSLVGEDDLAQLFFALGPNVLSQLIAELLKKVKSDADMEGVTALTVIRHSILNALQIPS